MKINFFILFFIFILLSADINAQQFTSDSSKKGILPLNEVYLGYGAVNGGRLGYRLRFDDSFSAEASVGKNFLFNDGVNKYYFAGGVNVYPEKYAGLFFSILGVYEKTNDSYGSVMAFSPNVGYFQIKPDKHISLHLRGGPIFYSKKRGESYTQFGLNLDASIGFIF